MNRILEIGSRQSIMLQDNALLEALEHPIDVHGPVVLGGCTPDARLWPSAVDG